MNLPSGIVFPRILKTFKKIKVTAVCIFFMFFILFLVICRVDDSAVTSWSGMIEKLNECTTSGESFCLGNYNTLPELSNITDNKNAIVRADGEGLLIAHPFTVQQGETEIKIDNDCLDMFNKLGRAKYEETIQKALEYIYLAIDRLLNSLSNTKEARTRDDA